MSDHEEREDEGGPDSEELDEEEMNEEGESDTEEVELGSPEGESSNTSDWVEGSALDDRPRPRRRGRGEPRAEFVGDERAQVALRFVQDILQKMGMDCRARLRHPKEGNAEDEINIEIAGKDAGRIIGKKGQVLQALQFLVHRVANRPGLERRHIMVDAEGYRSRRDNSLATMARRLGRQAVEEGKIITFEPMNPRDRRVVHLALAKFEGVITRSDGEGDDRRVQIIPVRRASPGNGAGTAPATPASSPPTAGA